MFNSFEKECIRNLQKCPVLRTFVNLKSTFTTEEYLLNIRNVNLCVMLSKFRLISYNLAIEKSRHIGPKLELERTYNVCNNQVVDDEFTF